MFYVAVRDKTIDSVHSKRVSWISERKLSIIIINNKSKDRSEPFEDELAFFHFVDTIFLEPFVLFCFCLICWLQRAVTDFDCLN